jgi:hypothetical protein
VVIVAPSPGASDANVTVDGAPHGQAPLVLRLAAGPHRFAFSSTRGPRTVPGDTTIVVRAGQTTSVALRAERAGTASKR